MTLATACSDVSTGNETSTVCTMVKIHTPNDRLRAGVMIQHHPNGCGSLTLQPRLKPARRRECRNRNSSPGATVEAHISRTAAHLTACFISSQHRTVVDPWRWTRCRPPRPIWIVALTDSELTLGRHMARNHNRHSARLGGLWRARDQRSRSGRRGKAIFRPCKG